MFPLVYHDHPAAAEHEEQNVNLGYELDRAALGDGKP
jgi:hypothetical protein